MKTMLAMLALALSAHAQCGNTQGCPCPVDPAHLDPYYSGCPNSVSASGAQLDLEPFWLDNHPSMSGQTGGVLVVEYLPPNAAVLFCQGTTAIQPVAFGDGLRCIGGSVMRLKVDTARLSTSGVWWCSYPYDNGVTHLGIAGNVPMSGGTRYYQCWYRNAAPFCTPATFNMSNAIGVTWLP